MATGERCNRSTGMMTGDAEAQAQAPGDMVGV
jgi:hypothetical protein